MPNAIAYMMLMIWPVVCVILFLRLPPERAIIWSILGGYLVLPPLTGFDPPLVPEMDKVSIPNVCAFLLCVFYLKRRVALWPASWTARLLLLGFVFGAVPTVLTNSDPIIFAPFGGTGPISFESWRLPGLRLIDILSALALQVIIILPFLMARELLASETGLRELLMALVIGGLAYSIPALIEIRLSPQLNTWIYGFFQHSFGQMMRFGGFRPIVFLIHALWVAFFFMTAVVAAMALARHAEGAWRLRLLIAAGYLAVVLVLCKSFASIGYAVLLAPLVFLATPRQQIRVAAMLGAIAVIYPVLRDFGLIPLQAILDLAEMVDEDRAGSLAFRFENEERLLERAQEKWLFGWGEWGRNLVRDPVTGEIETIPDGEWIIVFGSFGWLGYLSKMGLLALPLAMLWWHMKRAAFSPLVAPVALLLAVTLVDMLLNAILTPYTWMIAGAVLGHCEGKRDARPVTPEDGQPRTVMTPPRRGGRRTVM